MIEPAREQTGTHHFIGLEAMFMFTFIQLRCENGLLSQINITNSLVAPPQTKNQRQNILSWISREKARVS